MYDRLIADNGLCRSELLLKILKCNAEQAPRRTAVAKMGDAAGFGGGGRGWTRCLGGGGVCGRGGGCISRQRLDYTHILALELQAQVSHADERR